MVCTSCGASVPQGGRFCPTCGSPFEQACSGCGASLVPGARFCAQCGTPAPAGSEPPSATSPTSATGPDTAQSISERRLVTVLFADLVGFTALAEGRDAEAVRELLSKYFDQCQDVVGRYGGTVEKFIGDAVMAVWGAPIAHDDDAERAVRAALDLVDAVQSLGPGIQARAGVLTGEAAVTIGATNQGLVAGDLVNTASRLQSVAAPGTVLVGEQTEQATNSAIAYEPAGDQILKGKTAPVPAFRAVRIVAERGGRGRTDQLEAPFVGRDDEFRLLREVLLATGREKRPRLVSITGVAGVGKSRMVWELNKYMDGLVTDVWWHEGRSPAYGEGVTFWALGEMVRGRIGVAEGADDAATRAALTASVSEFIADDTERRWVERALIVLLGLEGGGSIAREELFSAWRTFFERIAAQGTVVLVFEDLHWADAGLLDFIDHMLDWSTGTAIMVVALARPELLDRRPGWGAGRRTFLALGLEPLTDTAMINILESLAPGLPEAGSAAIVSRADGIPLYTVETVRMLIADGTLTADNGRFVPTRDLADLAVPTTLQALIAARLDALEPSDRSLICDASVLGQSFSVAGAVAVSGLDPETVDGRLRSLARRELLTLDSDQRSPERGQFAFVQSLVREVAYGTLAKRDRRARHLAAARYFESLGEEEMAGALASHYLAAHRASAGEPEAHALAVQASLALRGAAERAAALGSHEQAVAYYVEALEVTEDPADRARLLESAGISAEAESQTDVAEGRLREAIEIWHDLGDRPAEAWATGLLGRAVVNAWRAGDAIGVLEPALTTFEDLEDDPALVLIEHQLARAYWFQEDRVRAVPLADQALGRAERLDDLANIADILVTKGALIAERRPYEGLGAMEAGRELAEDQGLNAIVVRALLNMSGSQIGRDPRRGLTQARDAMALARRIGFKSFLATAAGNGIEVAVELGDLDWVLETGQELTTFGLVGVDRRSILRGIEEATLLRGDPVDALFAEHQLAESEGTDLQAVANYQASLASRRLLEGRYAEAATLWEQSTTITPVNVSSDLPRAARAAIWAGDRPTADRLIGEIGKLWVHGAAAKGRYAGLQACQAALDGRRDEAVEGFEASLATGRELGMVIEGVLTTLDMVIALGLDDPAVMPRVAEARTTIEDLRLGGLGARFEAIVAERSGGTGSSGSSGSGSARERATASTGSLESRSS
jgi:class 3 adenylate cyclase/tetratricopeptide (TPR) repeat protein